MDWAKIKDGLKTVMEISGDCNKFIQDNEIWSANADQVRKNNVLCILANCIRLLACLYLLLTKLRALYAQLLGSDLLLLGNDQSPSRRPVHQTPAQP